MPTVGSPKWNIFVNSNLEGQKLLAALPTGPATKLERTPQFVHFPWWSWQELLPVLGEEVHIFAPTTGPQHDPLTLSIPTLWFDSPALPSGSRIHLCGLALEPGAPA